MSHKSEMAGPFNRGDTITNKHFTFYNLGDKTILYLLFNRNNGFNGVLNGKAEQSE